VSVRARLVRAAAVAYPPDARESDLEADVPVEIVVDPTGGVIDARAVGRTGQGFDEAAVQAVRGYHFSPAQYEGQPVRVRMRWVVHFRLH
jgi:TonB family protein